MTHPEDAVEDAGARRDRAASGAQARAYRAYLIRCWRDGPAWRFSLESIDAPRSRHGFGRLQEVMSRIEADLARDMGD
jgi:hypothetical protein